jgi:hypothetical protein
MKAQAMSPVLQPIRHLVQQSRVLAPWLLVGTDEPHAELLAMVWGPHFDRQHALELLAKLSREQSAQALPMLNALQSAADRFDQLSGLLQHRLRRLIVRHHRLQHGAAM